MRSRRTSASQNLHVTSSADFRRLSRRTNPSARSSGAASRIGSQSGAFGQLLPSNSSGAHRTHKCAFRICVLSCCSLRVEPIDAHCGEHAMSKANDEAFKLSPALELERIINLQHAEEVSSLSVDSLKRHHADKLVEL